MFSFCSSFYRWILPLHICGQVWSLGMVYKIPTSRAFFPGSLTKYSVLIGWCLLSRRRSIGPKFKKKKIKTCRIINFSFAFSFYHIFSTAFLSLSTFFSQKNITFPVFFFLSTQYSTNTLFWYSHTSVYTCLLSLVLTPGNPMNEWVSSMSCPQQPCAAPVGSFLWLLLWGQAISYLAFLFSCHLRFSQHYCTFQRTLTCHDVPKIGQLLLSFLLPVMFQVNLL